MIGVGLTGLTGDKVIAGCVSQEAEEGVVRKVRREGGGGEVTLCQGAVQILLAVQCQHFKNISATQISIFLVHSIKKLSIFEKVNRKKMTIC